MFGMGGTEILVILIVALLFLGPDKLPEAAKSISKGIRDIKKQSRVLQRTIEDDEHIGGAIRDLKSALRGEDEPYRPPPRPRKQLEPAPDAGPEGGPEGGPDAVTEAGTEAGIEAGTQAEAPAGSTDVAGNSDPAPASLSQAEPAEPRLTLPPTAGEPDGAVPVSANDDAELAAMVKPVANTIAHSPGPPIPPADKPERKHG